MNTLPNESACPKCGKPVSLLALEGLCPQCLMQAGFGPVTGTSGDDKRNSFVPPTPEELAQHFPQLEILELLGRGGMGAVYKARQTHLDRIVALKILPPVISAAPAFAERFGREARALARLHHPHIVTLYESGQTGDLFYFLMEYVDGVNLRQLLAAGTISPKDALAIVPQICDALQFAHDRGIVHRDIKPENILLSKAGQVKIADFGVAKLVAGESVETSSTDATHEAGQTEVGRIIGTPQYMAPEQISHPLEVDNRADIYALGVVFYQMLTGELPAGKFEPPSHKVRIDVRLDEIVLRALEKQPELRYPQASVLKTQVEMIAHGSHEPPFPHVQSPLTRSTPIPGTQILLSVLRWLAVAFAVFILCVISGGIILPHFLPKVYEANAQILVQPAIPGNLDSTMSQNVFTVMESRDVLLPVIKDLNLETTWGHRLFKSNALSDEEAFAYLRKNLKLDLRPGTNIVDITVMSDVPQEAAQLVNAIADLYKTKCDVEEDQRLHKGIDALRDQIAQQKQLVDAKKAELTKYLQELDAQNVVSGGKTIDQINADLDTRKKDLLAAQQDYEARQVLLNRVEKLPDDQLIETLNALGRSSPNIETLRANVQHREVDIANLLADGFSESHPRVHAIRAQIAEENQQIADAVAGERRAMQVDVDMAQSRVTLLQKQVDDLTAKLNAVFDPRLKSYYELRDQLEKQQSILDALELRIKQVMSDSQLQVSPVRILSRAYISTAPSQPNRRSMLAASALVGTALGFIVATGLEIVLWTRRMKAIQPARGIQPTMRSQASASSSQKGKVLAIAGAIFQPGSILALISVNVWQIMKLTALTAHGPTTMTALANAMQVLLSVTVAALAFFLGSLIALCIALVVSRYRANWFYHFLTIYSWPLLLIFPFGTAAGIFFLVYCLKRRDEFAS